MTKNKTLTRGNVIVEEIKVGDIHYEFGYGVGIKSKVLTLPIRDDDGYWTWESENVNNRHIITYCVKEGFAHYGPNLYTYEAYQVKRWI